MISVYNAITSNNNSKLRKLLEKPDNLRMLNSARNSYKESPLMTAVTFNNVEAVDILLEKGADPNSKCKDNGVTPFIVACLDSKKHLIGKLLKHGADLNSSTNNGITPLLCACMNKNTEIMEELVKNGADINTEINKSGVTTLTYCYSFKMYEAAEFLVKLGANIKLLPVEQILNAIKYANEDNDSRYFRLAVDNGCNPDIVIDKTKKSPLMEFVLANNLEMVKYVLQKGSDKHYRVNGDTNAFAYYKHNNEEMLKCMIEANISPMISTKTNQNLLHITANKCSTAFYTYLLDKFPGNIDVVFTENRLVNKSYKKYTSTPLGFAIVHDREDIVDLLIDRGADLNWEFGDASSTPIHLAITKENGYIINRLIDSGANLVSSKDEGTHAIHTAAIMGNVKIIEKLLGLGVNINIRDINHETPLISAIYDNNIEVVEYLVNKGADVHLVNRHGYNALTIAIREEYEEIANILFRTGSKVNYVLLHHHEYIYEREKDKIVERPGYSRTSKKAKENAKKNFNIKSLILECERITFNETDVDIMMTSGVEFKMIMNNFIRKIGFDKIFNDVASKSIIDHYGSNNRSDTISIDINTAFIDAIKTCFENDKHFRPDNIEEILHQVFNDKLADAEKKMILNMQEEYYRRRG